MILNISPNKHPHKPILGLEVIDLEQIPKLLQEYTIPTHDGLDIKAFNLISEIKKIFAENEAEAEKQNVLIAKWEDEFKALPTEKKVEYEKNGYLENFDRRPPPVEKYDGVLIGDDVPPYMVPYITSYLKIEGIDTYYNYHRVVYKTVSEPLDGFTGLSENTQVPSGVTAHQICLLFKGK